MKRIEEFSNQELLDELRRRCSPMIFAGRKVEDGNVPSTWTEWGGRDSVCYGLCHQLGFEIQSQMVNIEANNKGDEDA